MITIKDMVKRIANNTILGSASTKDVMVVLKYSFVSKEPTL